MLQPLIIAYQRCAVNSEVTATVDCLEARFHALYERRVEPRTESYLRDRLELNRQSVGELFFCLGLPEQPNLTLRAVRVAFDEWKAMTGKFRTANIRKLH